MARTDSRRYETRVSILQYNILFDELSSNFVPRTMEDPSDALVAEVFGTAADAPARWDKLKKDLLDEYTKWHPIKTYVHNPAGKKLKARCLWSEKDLLALPQQGWKLDGGVQVRDSTALQALVEGEKDPVTLRGIFDRHLDKQSTAKLYDAIKKVQEESRAWDVRGRRVLQKIKDARATFVVLEEYDVHELETAGHATFHEAMRALGYDGALFLGPGQEQSGIALFWLRKVAALPKGTELPSVVPAGMETDCFGNVDLEEPGMRDMDRRPLAWAKLSVSGQPVMLCGTHLMTGSRDKTGDVRAYELAKLRTLLRSRVGIESAVLLAGDFNIDSRGRKGQQIWEGGSKQESTGFSEGADVSGATWRRLGWERDDGSGLVLGDAYGDVATLEACSSTRTGTRLETIDYIFYDEAWLTPIAGKRSELRCPEEAMPNSQEPSDHIPLSVAFSLRKPLTKPQWSTVADVKPDTEGGINLMLKSVSVEELKPEGNNSNMPRTGEVVAGDASGIVTLRLRDEEQAECCKLAGTSLRLQNARVNMINGKIRLAVDKWAVLKKADAQLDFEVNLSNDISATEYERVR
eukprot:TRINITY_DN30014_c0_g1_i1.p1 TRINITY_DN30014_c0_g1~~TRINITY_DN30014_c0_g1_i1.p1  ORF type:complete len:610 (-),score=142.38 TRINITY_DN30014_c0_g1_i1:98-1831(-)